MPMKNPPHPGGFVLRQCIEPLGLTITDAATALGVTRTTLSELVNGKRGISTEMAVRLEKALSDADVDHRCEIYPGALHGWTMADFPIYNEAAAERHWQELQPLFAGKLR